MHTLIKQLLRNIKIFPLAFTAKNLALKLVLNFRSNFILDAYRQISCFLTYKIVNKNIYFFLFKKWMFMIEYSQIQKNRMKGKNKTTSITAKAHHGEEK